MCSLVSQIKISDYSYCRLWTKFGKKPPLKESVSQSDASMVNYVTGSCICYSCSGQPPACEQWIMAFICNARKSTRISSTELRILQSIMWTVLHQIIDFRPYGFQVLQVLSEEDNFRRTAFVRTSSTDWKMRQLTHTLSLAMKPRYVWINP